MPGPPAGRCRTFWPPALPPLPAPANRLRALQLHGMCHVPCVRHMPSQPAAAHPSAPPVLPCLQTGKLRGAALGPTLRGIYQAEGLPGLFRGNGASVLRIVPYAAVHFWCYEHYRRLLVSAQLLGAQVRAGDRGRCSALGEGLWVWRQEARQRRRAAARCCMRCLAADGSSHILLCRCRSTACRRRWTC